MQKLSNVHHRSEIAYVMINCESGCQTLILEEIKDLIGIKEIKCTTGKYDIILKIESDSIEQLRDLISKKIRRIQLILSTTTLLCTERSTPIPMQSMQ